MFWLVVELLCCLLDLELDLPLLLYLCELIYGLDEFPHFLWFSCGFI
jgi:hypothetical protein